MIYAVLMMEVNSERTLKELCEVAGMLAVAELAGERRGQRRS
jgi:hypothetical protein